MRLNMAITGALLAAIPAQAEVYKCKDPQGKIIYSDTPCSKNTTGNVIRINPNTNIVQSRMPRQTEQAGPMGQMGQTERIGQVPPAQYVDSRGDTYECEVAQRKARAARFSLQVAESKDQGRSWNQSHTPQDLAKLESEAAAATSAAGGACGGRVEREADATVRAQQNMQEGRAAAQAEVRARAAATITFCDDHSCYTGRGRVYSRQGNSNLLVGPNGEVCVKAGSMLQC